MPSIKIGAYEASIMLLLMIILAALGVAVTVAWFLFATRSRPLVVEEPLSITEYPSIIHTRPGENKTLDITLMNSAYISYEVTLFFALNESAYQESYITFSNLTYTIKPGSNNLTAWLFVQKNAPPAFLELTVDFYRQ
ncbi:MAG: hypothetical protein JSV05_05035 [Candidatus Bathyarchaeota archaeon]|nr:MAG: hypothetical protein JSV05_05035 [Candidatus Bathyarchaeota archaeon]